MRSDVVSVFWGRFVSVEIIAGSVWSWGEGGSSYVWRIFLGWGELVVEVLEFC